MISIARATVADASDLLVLQKLAYRSEAELYDDWSLPPLVQTVESLVQELERVVALKAVTPEGIVGSVRAEPNGGICAIGRLIVHPDFQRQGIGSMLMGAIEAEFSTASSYELFTGSRSEGNIRLYKRLGYEVTHTTAVSQTLALTYLSKKATSGVEPSNSRSAQHRR